MCHRQAGQHESSNWPPDFVNMQFYTDSFYYHATLHQSKSSLPYLLMLHGFMGNSHVFDPLMEELKSFCNPITIDLAGHGQTQSPTDPDFYTADRQVHQIMSIISRLNFENLYLYGYSMGGRLAFQILASHSKLFSAAFIESSHCGIQSDEERLSRQILDEKRAQQIESGFENFIEDWSNLPLFQHTPKNLKAVYENIMKQQNPEQLAASLRGFGAGIMPEICDQISNLNLPLTLIAGELDHKYVTLMTKLSSQFKSADLHIAEKAGHRVHTDQPKKLIQILKNTIT